MNLSIYQHEETRIIDKLLEATPGTDEYQALLRDLNSLTYVSIQTLDTIERLAFVEENDISNAPMNIVPLKPTPIVDETATVENAKAEEKEEPKMTFAELQSALTNAVRNGLAAEEVNNMITSLNYERLSDIPANLYPAVMQWLDEKVGAK